MDDRLSILPDPILCHILSFLPTDEAVATSFLSKRWRPLWRSVPTLDFDYIYGNKEVDARFIQSVYAFILSRDQHQPLHKFRIRLWAGITQHPKDPSNVTMWVNFAVQRRLEHLDICLINHEIHPLPPPIIPPDIFFTCSTNLVVLKLYGLSLKPLSSVDFPLLKTMHLQDLLFIEYECLALLLSRCPLLQDFIATSVSFIYHLPDRSNYKTLPVQFFPIRQINNQDLHSDERTNRSTFTMFHNLTHFELDNTMCNKDWLNIVEVLKYFPKLQDLVIDQQHDLMCEIVQFQFDSRDWQCPQPVPECILLHLRSCILSSYKGTEVEFQLARYIMQNGRVLKSMTICSYPYIKQEEKHENLKKISSCTRRSPTCELFFEE